MSAMETFMAYAADFEKSYDDDDWDRVAPHFSDDAVYEVRSESMGCQLTGPQQIVAGFKKSLDGFDRRFDTRTIEIVGDIEQRGDELDAVWKVHYTKKGLAPYTLDGRSIIRCNDGKVVSLIDIYERSTEEALAAWVRENDFVVDPSYV